LAPELLVAGAEYSARSDIWDLGITMMKLCKLDEVFFPDDPLLNPKINYNYEIKRIIKMCLNEVAECRPTATELLNDKLF
jgi:serine/threonine protein kinase